MKKLIAILITCSLAMAAGAQAQQDDEQKAAKKKQRQEARAERADEDPSPAKPEAGARKKKERPAAGEKAEAPAAQEKTDRAGDKAEMRAQKRAERQAAKANAKTDQTAAEADVEASESTAPDAQKANRRNKKKSAEATTDTTAATAPTAEKKGRGAKVDAESTTQTSAATAPTGNKPRGKKMTAEAKKAVVEKVKARTANFKAQPKPEKVPAVTFSQSRTIEGSQNWKGDQYTVFRSYRPERHDRSYYHNHYSRIELIAGGYYYFNNGYWYPAWGYQPTAQYYVYDGPIYAGQNALPPDQIIANVQAALQEMGYYRGEVDGLLGPLTREALTGYQTDYGLYATAVIDQPTLSSLGI